MSDNSKSVHNQDGEHSNNRERRKLTRKCYSEKKKNSGIPEDSGISNGSDKDSCDCLVQGCPGCHFPCPKCHSSKCGFECRVNRKWQYEGVEHEESVQ